MLRFLLHLLVVILCFSPFAHGTVQDVVFNQYLLQDFMEEKAPQIQVASEYLHSSSTTLPVNQKCKEDLSYAIVELQNGTDWAWYMLDAWGRPESGQILGNTIWEGRMSQCHRVEGLSDNGEVINPKYCSLQWPMPTWLVPAGIGMCVPVSCQESDLFEIVRLFNLVGMIDIPALFPISEKRVRPHCAVIPDITEDAGAIAAISILCLFAALGIAGSLYDVITAKKRSQPNKIKHTDNGVILTASNSITNGRTNLAYEGDAQPETVFEVKTLNAEKGDSSSDQLSEDKSKKPSVITSLLLSFSAYSHLKKLASIKHARGSYRSLNAVRFLTMCWILLGHTWQLGIYITERRTTDNVNELVWYYMSRGTHEAINQMHLAVETFFVLSAMLTTISFMKQAEKHNGKPPCAMFGVYYFHRYWRLTPVYMMVLMFYATMWPYLGTGPSYPLDPADVANCRTQWWTNLIYLQNLIDSESMCMGWAWYLACDFQFYMMAPMFLALLYWVPIAGIVMTTLGLCGNLIASIYMNHGAFVQDDGGFFRIYVEPWTRCGSYFVGIFLGYLLWRVKFKVNMNKVGVVFGWLISICAISTIVYIAQADDPDKPWSDWENIIYSSLQRPVMAAGVAWIIFACVTGNGGVINSIFSWVGWVPLAKLTYVGYLIHPIIVYFTFYSSQTQVYISDWNMVYYFLGNLALTLGASYIVSAFLEIPFLHLEKVMFRNVKR